MTTPRFEDWIDAPDGPPAGSSDAPPPRSQAAPPARSRRDQGAPRSLPEPTPLEPADLPLYEALRGWRRRLAAVRGLPPYLVLHNRTIAELARWRPKTLAELRDVRGIGEAKASAYGAAILAVVQAPCAGLPAEDALARVTALLLAADYDVAAGAPGALMARPRDGGPALWVALADLPEEQQSNMEAQVDV